MGTRETETEGEGNEGDRKAMTEAEKNRIERGRQGKTPLPPTPARRGWRADFGQLASPLSLVPDL